MFGLVWFSIKQLKKRSYGSFGVDPLVSEVEMLKQKRSILADRTRELASNNNDPFITAQVREDIRDTTKKIDGKERQLKFLRERYHG